MKILLTGFEPFNKSPINPSEQIVRTLDNEAITGVQLMTAILPVDIKNGPAALLKALETTQPEAVLCLGQASKRVAISIERLAVNLLDFRIPDNVGNQIQDQPVVLEGPVAYFTTLPVRRIFQTLKGNGIPAELSLSAGTYLCNQILYVLLNHLDGQADKIPAGFIHLPALPEQAAQMEGSVASMGLETMVRGIRTALQVIAKE